MTVVPKWEREWNAWIKDQVAKRALPCMARCGDKATKIKFLGKRTGAFCGGCYAEIYYGRIPPLDRRRSRRRR